MKLEELLAKASLKGIGRGIGLDVQMVDGYLQCTPLDPDDSRYSTDFILPSMKMVGDCRANDFDFFQPALAAGLLTEEQMHHAAERYHLGKTKSGRPIFWLIDDMLNPLDAHIAPDFWISTTLRTREPLLEYWQVRHCLFGLHLLTNSKLSAPVAIVENEQSAVILSELFPETIWMAYVSIPHLNTNLLAPLQGRTVTIYPRTDYTKSNYLFFLDYANHVRSLHSLNLHVDATLEHHATDSQKSSCIDILDFILQS